MESSSITSAAFIIISSFLMYYFILPNTQTLKLKYEKINKLDLLIEDAKEIQSIRDDLKDQYNQISETTLKYIRDILPVYTDITFAQGLVDLSSIASKSGLNKSDTLISISGEQGAISNIAEGVKESVVTVVSDVNINTIYEFVRQLNRWNRLVIIDSIEINSLKESPDVRMVIKIKMLFT